MALKINAATLYNKVSYTTDMESLKKVKKQMEDLKKQMKEVKQGIATPALAKKVINDSKASGSAAGKAFTESYEKERRINARKRAKDEKQEGITRARSTPLPITRLPLTENQSNSLIGKTQQQFGAEKQVSADKLRLNKGIERISNNILVSEARLLNMEGLTNAQRAEASAKMNQLLAQYKAQKVNMEGANTQMRLMLMNYSKLNQQQNALDAAKERQRKLDKREDDRKKKRDDLDLKRAKKKRDDEAYWNRRYALGQVPGVGAALSFGGWGVATVASAIAAAMAKAGISGALGRNKDLVNTARQSRTDPYLIQAISTWSKANGIDNFNVQKVGDIIKDINDKVGDFMSNAKLDPKTGQWKGSTLNDIANILKLDKDDIAKYQDKPIEFMNMLFQRADQLGLSQAQLVNVSETFGNDFSRLQDLFKNDAKALTDEMEKNRSIGLTLTSAESEMLTSLSKMSTAMDKAAEAWGNRFTVGFAEAIAQGGDLAKAMEKLNPLMESLGNLVGRIVNILGWIVENKGTPELITSNASQRGVLDNANLTELGASAGWELLKNYLPSWAGGNPTVNTNSTMPFDYGNMGYQSPYSKLSIGSTPIVINIAPDPKLGDVIQAQVRDVSGQTIKELTFSLNGEAANSQ